MIPEPTVADAVAQFTKNIGQFGVLIAILVTMGSVATEKERGTAAFLLTKPIGRGAFVAAKVVAIGALLALATGAWPAPSAGSTRRSSSSRSRPLGSPRRSR